MTGIGLRVYSNSCIFYAIIDKDVDGNFDYRSLSCLYVPLSLDKPERLAFVRNTLLDIFNEYNIQYAGIRMSEFTGHTTQVVIERYFLEGVIQESMASSPIEKYIAGQISTLTPLLGIERDGFKKLATAEETFGEIPDAYDWNKLSLEERESILVCHASFNI
jgi:hypothetical protein